MKNILVKAYLNQNLGDDLFIYILAERYKNERFYLINYNKIDLKKTFNQINIKIKNISFFLKIINYFFSKILNINSLIEKVICLKKDMCIEIGGSIFMEDSKEERNRVSLKNRIELLKKCKNKYFILGANFGPYKSKEYLEKYFNFFSKCVDICFREQYSYELFKNLKNIRYTKDIVFSLNKKEYENKKYVLISVIKPSLKEDLLDKEEKYYQKLEKIIREYLKNKIEVKLMSFCKNEGDEEAIRDILISFSEEEKKKITTYNYNGNIEEALKVIGESDTIIATRFHAMILGFIYAKKVYPIAYSSKTINVLKDLEFKGNYATFDNLENLKIENILTNDKLDKDILLKFKIESEKQFQYLDSILEREVK